MVSPVAVGVGPTSGGAVGIVVVRAVAVGGGPSCRGTIGIIVVSGIKIVRRHPAGNNAFGLRVRQDGNA